MNVVIPYSQIASTLHTLSESVKSLGSGGIEVRCNLRRCAVFIDSRGKASFDRFFVVVPREMFERWFITMTTAFLIDGSSTAAGFENGE
jgi:hypothetical protein